MLNNIQFSPVFLKQVKNSIDRILNVPGNYTKGNILEMTAVVDKNLTKEAVSRLLPELLRMLKQHDRVFQNVRFHVVYWETDESRKDIVLPMTMASMEKFYEDYEQKIMEKSVCRLAQYLTLFHARSKVIVLLTDGKFTKEDGNEVKKSMQPFLEKKMLGIILQEGNKQRSPEVCYREWGRSAHKGGQIGAENENL